MTKQKYLITSALPYANGPLHFGHIAGAYLPADCYARFLRLKNQDVLFISGSDEYGIAITMSAEIAKRTPKEHVDIFHEINKAFFKKLNISFDHYSRTTWKEHPVLVQQYFLDLLNNGYIEEKVTNQLYSEKDQKFLADRYVVGTCPKCGFANARGDECPECGGSFEAMDLINPRSKLSNSPLILKPTKHWFLLLDKFKEKLLEWLETKEWKPNVLNFIKGYIQDLRPRAITRDSNWGIPIPLPGTEGKVLYVWFDAPIGYLSATKEYGELQGNKELWKEYWCDSNTQLVNFIGKDNIPFHAAIFPAMTMGQNQPYKLVDMLPANEFYKLEGKQFSKSEGWYIDLEDFFSRYTADQIRYTIAANAPETSDSEFTWKDFYNRCNSELLGKYGNLVNRVLVFAHQKCGGKVPTMTNLSAQDQEFLDKVKALSENAAFCYQNFRLRQAAQTIMELAQLGNSYFDHKKPWIDAKSESTHPVMNTTIACCLECIKTMALISSPIIPETAEEVFKMLGYQKLLSWDECMNHFIPAHQALLTPKILFKKIEEADIEQEIKKLHELSNTQENPTQENPTHTPLKPLIDIEDVKKIDLRVGTILSAVAVEKSKKLIKLEVTLGFETRTVVAGIKESYQPEQLVGKNIVLVANLKPATLMGIESQGMILAGHGNGSLELPLILSLPPGSTIS